MLGTRAPVFQAAAVINGNEIVNNFSLEPFIGKQEVIFFFYPKDFTFVCPTELLAFQQQLPQFIERKVALVGCSTDSEESHLSWLSLPKEKGGIAGVSYPLVADSSKTIAANYGVLGGKWEYNEQDQLIYKGIPVAYRGIFLIDKEGIIRYSAIHDLPLGRSVYEVLRVVDMWQHVLQYGEVCPANWDKDSPSIRPTLESVTNYLTLNKKL